MKNPYKQYQLYRAKVLSLNRFSMTKKQELKLEEEIFNKFYNGNMLNLQEKTQQKRT